jgi:hypothetical protein
MKRRSRVLMGITAVLGASVVFAAVTLWLRLRPDANGREIPLFESIDMSALRQFTDGIRTAESVELYEGFLWHRGKQEMLKKHGFYFYVPAIVPTEGDAEALRGHVLNEATFEEWRGVKFCGGYHPDWFIRWVSKDGDAHELHLCFGCHEAKIYGPDYQLYCDVRGDAYKSLKSILERYHVRRDVSPTNHQAMNELATTVLLVTALILPALIFFAGGISRSILGTSIRTLLSIGCGWIFMIAYADAAPFLSLEPIRADILDFPSYFGWVLPAATVGCCLLIRCIIFRRRLHKTAEPSGGGNSASLRASP